MASISSKRTIRSVELHSDTCHGHAQLTTSSLEHEEDDSLVMQGCEFETIKSLNNSSTPAASIGGASFKVML